MKKITELLAEELNKCQDIEVYRYTGKNHDIHTDFIESLDVNINDLKVESINDIDFQLMDEDDYNNSILANSCTAADFDDWYGDKDAKILVIILKNN